MLPTGFGQSKNGLSLVMASIVSGFEYDIFISYRHHDNRGEWVTNFVNDLRLELATIMKEPVSVYFDSNLYDGLLETHHVDKSLEHKLNSLVFIPVLSQIYCDPKSFAWQHEFCVFNRLTGSGPLSREVALRSGNVGSRILPIVIHQLEPEDLTMIEDEIKTKLRSIDFTFRASGVNRPLRKEDKRTENVNNLSYADQLNKLANAVKEILVSIKNPGKTSFAVKDVLLTSENAASSKLNEKSLAVLPFNNLSNDASQDYFADGIMENIHSELACIKELRVISRTSVVRYKKATKTVPEIASELNVKYVIEGSAQTYKEKVRIRVQLINAAEDQPVWAKVFTESIDDLFEIQSNVASTVAKELQASLLPEQTKKASEAPTQNREAYDLLLKGRHAFNQWGVEGYRAATDYFKKAIALDPEFKEAYSQLASSYSARMSWNGDLSPQEAFQNIEPFLNEAWKRGATDNDYVTKSFIDFFIHKNFGDAEKHLRVAIALNENNSLAHYTLSYVLNMAGRFDEAQRQVNVARQIDPLSVGYFNYQTISLYLHKQYEHAETTLKEALQLFPGVIRFYDHLARLYLTMHRYAEARDAIASAFKLTTLRPPSMIAYLSMVQSKLNDADESEKLYQELIGRSDKNEKGVNVYLVHAAAGRNDWKAVREYHARAIASNDIDLVWWNVDPLLDEVRKILSVNPTPDFEGAEIYLQAWLEKEMPALPYHNYGHIQDVLNAAMIIADAENINDFERHLLRIAAWMHDAGFVYSPKDHEAKGAELAREHLPQFGFSNEQIELISGMIMATKLPQSPSNQLERILCDADLDYLGRDDFHPIASSLFKEMLEAGVVETEREWNLVQRTFLQGHKYHTEFGRKNREEMKQERLKEIVISLIKK